MGPLLFCTRREDCLDPANWRPITLLCVDYKIAAEAPGNRLLQVIASVVSPDQSCGIPGRSPAENVRLLLDVACYADQNNIGGAIVSLDQEKAFDRVEISFLMKVLERVGFGLFSKYERASGACLNQGKCCGLLLSPWRNRTSFPVDLKWSSSYIKVLGARISPDGSQDWEPALKALDRVFVSWQHRRLSYRGRALVGCMLGVSRFWYLGSTVPVDSHLAPRISRSVFSFIWDYKRE